MLFAVYITHEKYLIVVNFKEIVHYLSVATCSAESVQDESI